MEGIETTSTSDNPRLAVESIKMAAAEQHAPVAEPPAQKKRGRPKGSVKKDIPSKPEAAMPSARIIAAKQKQALAATAGNTANDIGSEKVERRGRPKGSKNKVASGTEGEAKKKGAAKPVIGEKRKRGRPAK